MVQQAFGPGVLEAIQAEEAAEANGHKLDPALRAQIIREAGRVAASELYGLDLDTPERLMDDAGLPKATDEPDSAAPKDADAGGDQEPPKPREDDEAKAAERAEIKAAIGRMELFDPSDEADVREQLASNDEDTKAIAELRLELMDTRGEFASTYSPQIIEQIEQTDRELVYLQDELDNHGARLTRRERDALEAKYLELSRLAPRLRAEMDTRIEESRVEPYLAERAERDAREAIMEEKRAALRRAKGELSPEDMLAGKEPPKPASTPKIQALEWEAQQEPDPTLVKAGAEKRLREMRKAYLAGLARRRKEEQAATAYNRRVFELYDARFSPKRSYR
jgi:hypothetical protein